MRLFFVGDFSGNNGPASVNKSLKNEMPNDTLYSAEKNKFIRVLELVFKISKTDAVLFSGLSKINIIGFKIAKLLRKKSAYLMHGSQHIEGEINQNYNVKSVDVEYRVLECAPIIICVSEIFMNRIKEHYPEFKDKITYVNNGIDWNLINISEKVQLERQPNLLLSVGGGAPRKGIVMICEAIKDLNENKNLDLKLIVIGANGKDTNKIKSYPFVTYIEKVSQQDMVSFYKMAQLYIQNSVFETFGLAPIEALMCGGNILISQNVGVNSLLKLEGNELIYNVENIEEISKKILFNMSNSNNNKIINSLNKESTSVKASYQEILQILK
ncbi:glycosyltransferase family 4 protein [Priestia megaterium]|uniref:glycosyltransferase family 4 protein n=1 Tax=Priestia megaterium TaxID=1404 RepID=UPI00207AC585|nr:glycosyltransferase family 4 protein [Priestia megaterium]USL27089.1 glycosyltransferase family 4 protein [Priestia megaterium]